MSGRRIIDDDDEERVEDEIGSNPDELIDHDNDGNNDSDANEEEEGEDLNENWLT